MSDNYWVQEAMAKARIAADLEEQGVPEDEIDATMYSYPHAAARSWDEIIDSPDYEERWRARDPYERWAAPLPSALESIPPEVTGLREGNKFFEPASLLGLYFNPAEDDEGPRSMGHPMWTAINRLFGCLCADKHPDTPATVTHRLVGWTITRLATPDDVRKLAALAKIAAREVLDGDWTDQISPQLDEVTTYDRTIPDFCDRILAATDDQIYDTGVVVHPTVLAAWAREADRHRYLTRLIIDPDGSPIAVDPEHPGATVSVADIAAALHVQDREELRNPGAPLCHLWWSGWDQPDAWKAIGPVAAEIRNETSPDFGDFDARTLLAPTLRTPIDACPRLGDLFSLAFRATSMPRTPTGDPLSTWPKIGKIIHPATEHTRRMNMWAPMNVGESRKLLALLRDVASHLLDDALREQRLNREFPFTSPQAAGIYTILRRLEHLDTFTDDHVTTLVGVSPFTFGTGYQGLTYNDGTPVLPTRHLDDIDPAP